MSTPHAAPYWSNRPARPDETDAILALVQAVHANTDLHIDETYWRWRYLSDTAFRADIIVSEHEGRPIGIQPVAIFDWRWGQSRLKGAMYTGVLTHPDHRRRGIFRSLIESSNEHAARRGAQFSMTLPNELSLPGFLRFGDWQYPGLIPLFMKVIDGRVMVRSKLGGVLGDLVCWAPGLFFRRRGGAAGESLCFDRVERLPPDLDEVADQYARGVERLMILRTADYWNWRYASKPRAAYRLFTARDAGRVIGAVATSRGVRGGFQVGMIMDVVSTASVSSLRGLIRCAEDDLRQRGLGLSSCQATSPILGEALRAEGYHVAPPRLIRKRFHFVFRRTGVSGLPADPNEIGLWHLNFGDSDNA